MAKFIKLTTASRDTMWLNTAHIVAMAEMGSATQIMTTLDVPSNEARLNVMEKPVQILALIAAAILPAPPAQPSADRSDGGEG